MINHIKLFFNLPLICVLLKWNHLTGEIRPWLLTSSRTGSKEAAMKPNVKVKDKVKKQAVYECETCGSTADKPQECCGQPMKRKNRRIPEDDMVE
jgi:hypothetical protein